MRYGYRVRVETPDGRDTERQRRAGPTERRRNGSQLAVCVSDWRLMCPSNTAVSRLEGQNNDDTTTTTLTYPTSTLSSRTTVVVGCVMPFVKENRIVFGRASGVRERAPRPIGQLFSPVELRVQDVAVNRIHVDKNKSNFFAQKR
ncbi:hypothetical protein Q1695_013444 [Nippostrongylus brasiliensis]|nr:hypothetical protein Q1695_013444 [Nippostrongylus brasiliensis]